MYTTGDNGRTRTVMDLGDGLKTRIHEGVDVWTPRGFDTINMGFTCTPLTGKGVREGQG